MADQDLTQFDADKADIQLAVAPLLSMQVTSVESRDSARQALAQLKALEKRVDERRKSLTRPLDERIKNLIELQRNVIQPVGDASKFLSAQILKFESEEHARRVAEAKRQAAEEEERRKAAQAERDRVAKEAREKAEAEAKALADKHAEEERLHKERLVNETKLAEEEEDRKREAASLFGGKWNPAAVEEGRIAKEAADRAAEEARAEKARAEAKEIREKLERQVLEDQARLDREELERQKEAQNKLKAIEATRLKGARMDFDVVVIDIDQVPVQFLNREIKVAELKKEHREGRAVPGIVFQEKIGLTVRSEPIPSIENKKAGA